MTFIYMTSLLSFHYIF